MTPARGQVWQVPLARSRRLFLIIESDAALNSLPHTHGIVCAQVDQSPNPPDTVVTVPLTQPVQGTVVGTDITALTRRRLESGEYVGKVGDNDMERVSTVLRVVLDLTD